jgi:hypothetical protein
MSGRKATKATPKQIQTGTETAANTKCDENVTAENITGCVSGSINRFKTCTFDTYTSLRKATSEEKNNGQKDQDMTQNEANQTIHQQITLYVDKPPTISNNSLQHKYEMGKDAALSTVTTAAYNHVKDIRALLKVPMNQETLKSYLLIDNKTGAFKMTREDASTAWDVILSLHKGQSEGETTAKKKVVGKNQTTEASKEADIRKLGSMIASNNLSVRTLISNFAFAKAIMDSACLGETVGVSILYGLCESMRSPENTIVTGLDIQNLRNVYANNDELLDFLLRMAYCDVFELVSSDRLGAVNSLYTIRAIHDTLPVVSYVSIPKGSGGQIGTDIDVFIIAVAISALFSKHQLGAFPAITSIQSDTVNNITIGLRPTKNKKYYSELKSDLISFREFLKGCKGGICQTKDDLNRGICQTNNEINSKIKDLSRRMMKYITDIGTLFSKLKGNTAYNNMIEEIKATYEPNKPIFSPAINENIVWFSFQVFRYYQTLKFVPNNNSGSDYKEQYKETLCDMLNMNFCNYKQPTPVGEFTMTTSQKNEPQNKWYDALKKVAINESFIGHDNKSQGLLKFVRNIYGDNTIENQLGWVFELFETKDGVAIPPTFDDLEQKAIKRIQQETNCMFFQWSNTETVKFSGNTNMIFNKTIDKQKTSDGIPVYEIFINNIGAQRVISTYDLEKYSGETTLAETAKNPNEGSSFESVSTIVTGSNQVDTEPTNGVEMETDEAEMETDEAEMENNKEQEQKLKDEQFLIDGLVKERNDSLSDKDKILEVQGVICALDRASRTSHPRTIYCTGCLNIPFTTKVSQTYNITTTLSYKFAVETDPCPVVADNTGIPAPGLHGYKLFINTSKQTWEKLYDNFFNNPPSQDKNIMYISVLLSYLSEIIIPLSASDAAKLIISLNDIVTATATKSRPKTNPEPSGVSIKLAGKYAGQDYGARVNDGNKIIEWLIGLCKNFKNTDKSGKGLLMLNFLKMTKITMTIGGKIQVPESKSKNIVSTSNTATNVWSDIFYTLLPNNTFNIGFTIVTIFNQIPEISDLEYKSIQSALKIVFLERTFGNIYTCNINTELPAITLLSDSKPSVIETSDFLSNAFGPDVQVSIEKIKSIEGLQLEPATAKDIETANKTLTADNITPENTSKKFTAENLNKLQEEISKNTDNSVLLLLQTILSNETYGIALDEAAELFKEQSNHNIREALEETDTKVEIVGEAIDTSSQSTMDLARQPVPTNALSRTYAIHPNQIPQSQISGLLLDADVSKQKRELDNQLISYNAIISAIDTWIAKNCDFENISHKLQCDKLDTFKENISFKIEEIYEKRCALVANATTKKEGGAIKTKNNYSNKNMRGGTEFKAGDLVLKIYNKETHKYSYAKYTDVFQKYFENQFQNETKKVDEVKMEVDDEGEDTGSTTTEVVEKQPANRKGKREREGVRLGDERANKAVRDAYSPTNPFQNTKGGKKNLIRNVLYNKYMSDLKNNSFIKQPTHGLVTHRFRTHRKKHKVKLTRKKQKKVKARKTRHKAKKHRYTRNKK